MTDPFGVGAGIVGVISLTIQITQVICQFGQDWKDAPRDAKNFIAELGSLKIVLSETNTNLLLQPDFAEAFQGRPSVLLSQLGPQAPVSTDTHILLKTCRTELEIMLNNLRKRQGGHRLGWERLKSAILAERSRSAIQALHRQCQTLNSMMSIDAALIGAMTIKEVKKARNEQHEHHETQIKATLSVGERVDTLHRNHQTHADTTVAIRDGISGLHGRYDSRELLEEHQAIMNWLTPIDYAPQQNDLISRRQEGTGQWLLDSEEFKKWLDESGQTMFCAGMPGAGKTIMTSIVVNHLHGTFCDDPTVAIAYLYCNFRQSQEQKPIDLLSSVLKQLIQERADLAINLKDLHRAHKAQKTRPSFVEVSKALQDTISKFSKTFLIVDALDECQLSNGNWREFLSELFEIQTMTSTNIFATSRFNPEIRNEFQGSISLEIRASSDDVQKYLEGQVSRLPSFVSRNAGLKDEIKAAIIKAVDGMFLLARLHIDSLIGKRSPKAVRTALGKLPTGSDAYDNAYDDAMKRIEGQVEDSRVLAKQVLSWITSAIGRLRTQELRHALAVEACTSMIDEDNLPQVEDLVSVCAGLVTIDEESDIIRLVHYTTQEYFERTSTTWFPDARKEISQILVTYLSFSAFEAGFCSSDAEYDTRLQLNPLFEHAAQDWGIHVQASGMEEDPLVLDLLMSDANVIACVQAIEVLPGDFPGYSQLAPRLVNGMHLAAYFGLSNSLNELLKAGLHPDTADSKGRTPLSIAAENGHYVAAKLLVEDSRVNVNSKDRTRRTPLSWAAETGSTQVVQLLLEQEGVDVNSEDWGGSTPLSFAVSNYHVEVLELLLEKEEDAGISTKDTISKALVHAIECDQPEIVELLLEKGVSPLSEDGFGETALTKAAFSSRNDVLEILIDVSGVNPDFRDCCGRSLLWFAAAGGRVSNVERLLVKYHCDPALADNLGRTPLSIAAWKGNHVIVDGLIEEHVKRNITVPVRDLIQASDKDVSAYYHLICDLCTSYISTIDMEYHCEMCANGDWDICEECFKRGGHCRDKSHELVKRVWSIGRWISASYLTSWSDTISLRLNGA